MINLMNLYCEQLSRGESDGMYGHCAKIRKGHAKLSGYALSIRMGSELLMQCTKTECEFFSRKAYDYLDPVKTMEDGFKLSDPKSKTNHRDYSTFGPIGFIAWVQNEHSKFIRDHEWPALASTLPGSNNDMSLTCYNCGENGHIIKPNCPTLNDGHRTSDVTTCTPSGSNLLTKQEYCSTRQ
jgi:hypothetical protein